MEQERVRNTADAIFSLIDENEGSVSDMKNKEKEFYTCYIQYLFLLVVLLSGNILGEQLTICPEGADKHSQN